MDDKERLEVYERVHLRNHEDLTEDEKINKLKTKHRSKWIQIIFNVVVITGLAYGFLIGYRPFPEWVYYILGFIFILNVVLLYWQKNQIEELADYLYRNLDTGSKTA